MRFSKLEIKEILKAWILVSLMFAIAFSGLNAKLLFALPVSLITAGIGFLLHELAHKFIAQKYGCWAEFRANNKMLLLGLLFSFFGFVLAAPGGVFFHGGEKHQGKIAVAGPAMNIIIAAIFAALSFITIGAIQTIAKYGWMINAWLATFNLIPAVPFDGRAVFKWNKIAYAIALICAIGLTFYSFI